MVASSMDDLGLSATFGETAWATRGAVRASDVQPAYLTMASINRYMGDVEARRAGDRNTRPAQARLIWKWHNIDDIPLMIERTGNEVCVDLQSIRNERERKREQEGSEKSSRHGKDGSANPGNPAASVPLELMTVIGEAKSVIKSVQDARRMPAARVSLPAKGPHMSASRDRIVDPREDLLIGACGSLLAADSRLRDSEVSEEIRRRSRTVPKPQSVHISNISAPRKLFAGQSTPPMLQYSLVGFEPGPASQKDQDNEWAEHDGKHAVTDTRTLHVRTSVVVVPPVALKTPNGHQLARLAPDVHMSLDSELELTNERRGFKPAFAEMKPLVVSRTKGGATEVPFARFGQSRATDSRIAGINLK